MVKYKSDQPKIVSVDLTPFMPKKISTLPQNSEVEEKKITSVNRTIISKKSEEKKNEPLPEKGKRFNLKIERMPQQKAFEVIDAPITEYEG